MKLSDLGLNPMILQALEEIGFEIPTPVQAKAIPHLINSEKDLIALATGTKQSFLTSNSTNGYEQSKRSALILCPTRELAIQITKDIEKFIDTQTELLLHLFILEQNGQTNERTKKQYKL